MSLAHITPYPLCWPTGWERTPEQRRRRAYSTFKGATFERARRSLFDELRKLGSRDVMLSTNQPVRLDGMPYAAARLIADPGVAVYFTRSDGRQYAMARDAYCEMAANLRSLALAIEHLRGLERHGGDMMVERAFSGFAALPAPGQTPNCWIILGIDPVTEAQLLDRELRAKAINDAYRAKARIMHPDAGGTNEQMATLNQAREDALREAGAA